LKSPRLAAAALALLAASCVASGVVASDERGPALEDGSVDWRRGTSADVPGLYVSTEIAGPIAASLRKVVYLFDDGGGYAGAALIDDPSRFEVIRGTWAMEDGPVHLDGGAPATLEVAGDGSLRLSGDGGRVTLRRERAR
jgi:hypothetical protein